MCQFLTPPLYYIMVHKAGLCICFVHWCIHRTETLIWHKEFTECILVELLNLNSKNNSFRKHMGILMTSIRFQNSVALSPTTHKDLSFIHIFMACKNRNRLNKIPNFLNL